MASGAGVFAARALSKGMPVPSIGEFSLESAPKQTVSGDVAVKNFVAIDTTARHGGSKQLASRAAVEDVEVRSPVGTPGGESNKGSFNGQKERFANDNGMLSKALTRAPTASNFSGSPFSSEAQQMETHSWTSLEENNRWCEASDNEMSEDSVDDDEERVAREVIQRAIQRRTVGSADFAEPSTFLDRLCRKTLNRVYRSGDSPLREASDSDSSDEEFGAQGASTQKATRSKTLRPADFPEPSTFLSSRDIEAYSRFYGSSEDNSGEASDTDSSEESADGDEEHVAEEVIQTRSRTLGPADFPEPSSFLKPQEIEAYNRVFLEYDDDSSEASVDGGAERVAVEVATQNAARTRSLAPAMHFGPRQLRRPFVRRRFPSPVEYLSQDELVVLVGSFP
eukprot:TRINITY_DN34633_c0_g1_i1.p1 TRINITY_DN34633_c0_g1~~TRINITY_DN34633_c0_g1_i1.p1  ORF type:complete len:395 (+),score=55.56 TRINITY_DN34633_c0_g1_i1:53-1237(+)